MVIGVSPLGTVSITHVVLDDSGEGTLGAAPSHFGLSALCVPVALLRLSTFLALSATFAVPACWVCP